MDIRKLQRAIVDGLEDVKAQNIVVFNTEHLSPLFERVIIASGTSNRQTKALASSVRETVKGRGMSVMRTEGEDNGEWIIVDCGAAVVHVMQPAIREYYHLEEIWGDKPVKLKLGSTETKLVKASEDPEPAKKPAAKKAAAKAPAKTPAKAAPKAAAKAPAKVAAKSGAAKPAAKTAAKKAAPAKKAVSRVVGSKTPVSKTIKVGAAKPAAKKAAPAKKAPAARKPVAAKPAAKPAAKKTAAKK
ncbi:MAG: ribosome silencing factor [Roseateles depolymerans]|uniref:Ribosomal silencing factor RsfS n=1 Tax=Roseateles depolymerans TaxID=76731 RepID=A0A2W5FQ25_9BURK|nr:MAG: ribosome silencing factor [Roseateles depolymerans]